MYSLIDEFKVPCPPEDLVVFATLFNTITMCRNSIDKALTERDGNINEFWVLYKGAYPHTLTFAHAC